MYALLWRLFEIPSTRDAIAAKREILSTWKRGVYPDLGFEGSKLYSLLDWPSGFLGLCTFEPYWRSNTVNLVRGHLFVCHVEQLGKTDLYYSAAFCFSAVIKFGSSRGGGSLTI